MKHLLSLICVMLLLSTTAHGEALEKQNNLRTLFTSNHVRNELDKQRNSGKFDNIQQQSTTAVVREPVTVKMQGVVIRQNQKPVVFVNDSSTLNSATINDEIRVNPKRVKKKNYKVPVRVNQSHIKLKPGQQWNESDKQVQDNYQIRSAKAVTSDNDESQDEADNTSVTVP